MPKKIMLVSVIAILAMAISASAALAAPKFEVKGGGTDLLSSVNPAKEAFVLKASGQPTIECTKTALTKGEITSGSATGSVEHIVFSGCVDVSNAAECEVGTGGVIETVPVTATLEDGATSPNTKVKFKPTSGSEFAKFTLKNISGKSCPTKVTLKVTGTATSLEQNNSTFAGTKELSFNVTEASKTLEYAEKFASFKGKTVLTGEKEFLAAF